MRKALAFILLSAGIVFSGLSFSAQFTDKMAIGKSTVTNGVLDVNGAVYANSYHGDGSALTGLTSGAVNWSDIGGIQTDINGSGFNWTDTSALTPTFVPKTTTITINGTTQDLSSDRSWTVSGAMTYPGIGIAKSTGSAWDTSLTTSGTGTVLALTASPSFTGNVSGTTFTATTFTGALNGNASTVTTNANLTGPITSAGNATSIASQTGTGTTFAMSAAPTFTGNVTAGTMTATTFTGALNGNATTATGALGLVAGTYADGKYCTYTASGTVLNCNSEGGGGSMTYPGVGIAKSTGSGWDTSLMTTGTGTVVALSAAPTFTGNVNGSTFTATTFTGALNGNASTVTTNANLTGPITSSGNATAVASQTGTGTTFVMSAAPTFTGNVNGSTFTATTFTGALSGNATTATTASTVTTNANLTGPITSVGNATSIAAQTGTGTTFAMSVAPNFTGNVTAGTVTATTFTGALNGNALTATTSTTATNATNVGTTLTATNANYYPLMVSSASTTTQAGQVVSGLMFNPSTNTLTVNGSGYISPVCVTSDPCATKPEGTMFYNCTNHYWCFCNNASVDLAIYGNQTQACF